MTVKNVAAPEMCTSCRKGLVEVIHVQSVYAKGDLRVSFYDEFSKCKDCGEEFYTYEQSMARSRAITDAIRKSENRLTGDEIRSIRLKLGMSLPQFEKAMGVGKKTIGRWERGTVPPTGAANLGLWLAANHPETFKAYAQSHGLISAKILTDVSGQTSQSPSTVRASLTLMKSGQQQVTATSRVNDKVIETAVALDKESIEA